MKSQTCLTCGVDKPLQDFHRSGSTAGSGYRRHCKCCRNITGSNGLIPSQGRRANGLKRFGLTLESYEAIATGQNGVCAICQGHNGGRQLAVDHDHKTGSVRGLLCTRCNIGLGQFKDNPELMARAIAYLAGN